MHVPVVDLGRTNIPCADDGSDSKERVSGLLQNIFLPTITYHLRWLLLQYSTITAHRDTACPGVCADA